MADHIRALLSSGQYSDFTIECKGHSFKVDKSIVCSQSPVLDRAVCGEFEEAKTNIVNIDAFQPEVVWRMLCFMYGLPNPLDAKLPEEQYSEMDDLSLPQDEDPNHLSEDSGKDCSENCKKNPLILHVETNAIADYYNVTKLADLAIEQIGKCMEDAGDYTIDKFLEAAEITSAGTGDAKLHKLFAEKAVDWQRPTPPWMGCSASRDLRGYS